MSVGAKNKRRKDEGKTGEEKEKKLPNTGCSGERHSRSASVLLYFGDPIARHACRGVVLRAVLDKVALVLAARAGDLRPAGLGTVANLVVGSLAVVTRRHGTCISATTLHRKQNLASPLARRGLFLV